MPFAASVTLLVVEPYELGADALCVHRYEIVYVSALKPAPPVSPKVIVAV